MYIWLGETTASSVNKTHTHFYGIKRRQVKHKIYIYFIFMHEWSALELKTHLTKQFAMQMDRRVWG